MLGNAQLESNISFSADPGVSGYTVQQTVPAPPHLPVESCGTKRESPDDVGWPDALRVRVGSTQRKWFS